MRMASLLSRGRCDADVRVRGQAHAEVADRGREHRADHEEDRPADLLAEGVGRQEEQQDEHDDDEDAERAELAVQVGGGALLDRLADLLHLRGAFARGENLSAQDEPDSQGDKGDYRDDPDENAITPAEL
jgi:hypothetical protein